jgi:hypothetical protein
MTKPDKEHDEADRPDLAVGGNVSGQVGMVDNVIQIGSISGGQVVFNPPGSTPSPGGEAPTGPALPQELYTRLRTALLACGPFADDQAVAALFIQEGLSQWRYDIPEADSAGERVERVIAWLWPKETGGENGLVHFLRVLAGRYEPPAGCRQQLENIANELAQT